MAIDPSKLILIIDDSDDDYDATVRALRKDQGLRNPLHRCENGYEALDYLLRRGRYAAPAEAPRPGIILLDLNMPGLDGRKVLSAIKTDRDLRSIPVVVMSNSDDESDIVTCYDGGANTYIRKPMDWSDFLQAIRRMKDFWFEIAVLPST